MYNFALHLIKKNEAYVDTKFKTSTKRHNVNWNIYLFSKMYYGDKSAKDYTLRAKIDLNHPNKVMRDPVLYRVKHIKHWNTHKRWYIYPTYDFAQPICDKLEEIHYSLCTLEFEIHKPLYNWILDKLYFWLKYPFYLLTQYPIQIEYNRLNIQNVDLSKRKIRKSIEEGKFTG